MSYRTLRVDGRVYQYSIGRRYTHIRGVGTFSHEQIGHTSLRGQCDQGCAQTHYIGSRRE